MHVGVNSVRPVMSAKSSSWILFQSSLFWKVSARTPCFLRLDSWMRANDRAIMARTPRCRGSMAACSREEPSP